METGGRTLAEGIARVVAVERGMAVLEAEPKAACGGCKAKAGCGTAYAAGKARHSFAIPNDFGAKIGELVVIGIASATLTRASLVAYLLPLAGMVAAGIIATLLGASDAGTAAAALLGLIAGIAFAKVRAGRMARGGELTPVFLRRAGGEGPCP